MTAVPDLISFRLRVGVTGHRELSDILELERAVASVLDLVSDRFAPERTPVVFRAVSPIAEGADRLVARTVLKRPDADLIVLLPFAPERYLKDFTTETSKAEFKSLFEQALSHRVVTGDFRLSDEECYERIGRDVVDHADVLIALWDGRPARGVGGTASIVDFARGGSGREWVLGIDRDRAEAPAEERPRRSRRPADPRIRSSHRPARRDRDLFRRS